MRILIVNRHRADSLGGSEMQCDLIARGLSERGHHVLYCAARPEGSDYSDFPYRVVPLTIERPHALATKLESDRPDVVYWRLNRYELDRAISQVKAADVPFVFAVSNPNDLKRFGGEVPGDYVLPGEGILGGPRTVARWLRAVLQATRTYRALKRADAMTVLSRKLLDRAPVTKKSLIRDAVSPDKAAFSWPRPYCLWVANVTWRKRPELFVNLAQRLSERLTGTDFVLIGPIGDPVYRQRIESAHQKGIIHHLGFQTPDTVNGALEKARCLIHTCGAEGFPNNFIQAWMQGCPVVSLEFDPDGLIKDQGLGFVSGTEEQLDEDVIQLVHDEGLRREIGERARAFALEHFRPERMVTDVESFLEHVVSTYPSGRAKQDQEKT